MKVVIDRDIFEEQVLNGLSIKDLQAYWNCSRTTITDRKKEWGLIGISPNSKQRDNGDGTKLCKSCLVNKPVNEFHSNGYVPNGSKKLKPSCKLCEQAEIKSKYYATLKSILEEQGRKYECELCGYKGNHSALCFHHHTPEKNFEIANSKTIARHLLASEIAICKMLCQNCHHEIHNPTLMIYYGDV